jgi:hypothetical protein
MESVSFLLFIVISVGLWFLPFVLIIGSNKTTGKEKFVWLFALFFISWFAWVAYIFLAPLGADRVGAVK